MKKSLLAFCFLLSVLCSSSASAVFTAQWTLQELIQQLQQALQSGDPLEKLLATKINDALAANQITIVDSNIRQPQLIYSGWRAGLNATPNLNATRSYVWDAIRPLGGPASGSCSVPLPGSSLLAVESDPVVLNATIFGADSTIQGRFGPAPGQFTIGASIHGRVAGTYGFGFIWGGTYPVPVCLVQGPDPCPPFGCPKPCLVPGFQMVCQSWKDQAGINSAADIKGSIDLTLTTGFSSTAKKIVVSKGLALSGTVSGVHGAIADPNFGIPSALIPYVTPDWTPPTNPSLTLGQSAGIMSAVLLAPASAAVLSGTVLAPLAPFAPQIQGLMLGASIVHTDIETSYLNSRYQDWLAQEDTQLNQKYGQPLEIILPDDDLNGTLLKQVIALLGNAFRSAALADFVRQNLHQILYLLLTNDKAGLEQLLLSVAACQAIQATAAPMQHAPIFTRTAGGQCTVATIDGIDQGSYFSDSQCATEVAFRPGTFQKYCDELLAPAPNAVLGNAASWQPDTLQPNDPIPTQRTQKWTVSYGAAVQAGIDAISSNSLPYMKRVEYKSVVTDSGVCELEMRAYKKDVSATNLKPLIAIHGGSWSFRGFTYSGIEAQISHFTDRGFIVFAPFYRLIGHADANAACNGAKWFELISDVESALAWVRQYGPALGAKPGTDGHSVPVAVWGQSAGAHLSAYLSVYHPSDVSRGLLLYAPLDAQDFFANYQTSFPQSVGILTSFCKGAGDQLDPQCVAQNSLFGLVNAQTPPLFMIQGTGDTIVPYQQSSGMCSRYGNTAVGGTSVAPGSYGCGRMSQLRLVNGAEHALDAFCLPGVFCPAGPANVDTVKSYLSEGRRWLGDDLSWLIPILDLLLSD